MKMNLLIKIMVRVRRNYMFGLDNKYQTKSIAKYGNGIVDSTRIQCHHKISPNE